MLKNISVVALTLALSTNAAFADHKHHKKHKHYTPRAKQASYNNNNDNNIVNYKSESIPTLVAPVVPVNDFEPSFYLGASAGSRVNYTSAPTVYNGLEGTIFGGYGGLMGEKFYFAGELEIADSAVLSNDSGTNGSIRSSWSAAISILPGFMLTPNAVGYLRGGFGYTNFTASNSNSATGGLGLGLQIALSQTWNLRGEYRYNFYRNISSGTPRAQQFNLGAFYKFI